MPHSLAVALALAVVYVLWGSTAPAMKVAVVTVPPWCMAAIRFFGAGAILWTYCRVRGVALPSRADWRSGALSGIILLVLGNGIFAWTLQYIPSGVGALFFALVPAWMAIMGWFMYRERLSALGIAGLALGLGGMVYLYSPSGHQNLPTLPTALGVLSSLAWAFGSMLQRRHATANVVQIAAVQMLCAALVLAVLALVSGERLTAASFTPPAIGALLFLIVFGSVVGFSAFVWLVRNVPTTLASTYSYANPIVALIIGIGWLHEAFNWHLVIGGAVIVLGVALMIAAPKPAAMANA